MLVRLIFAATFAAVVNAVPPPFPSLIRVGSNASKVEVAAATFLQKVLGEAGVSMKVVVEPPTPDSTGAAAVIAVGFKSAVDAGVSSTALLKLGGNDSYILAASQLPAAGSIAIGAQPGSMRGCLLGASKLLTMLGFDFIAADETVVPDGPLTSSIRSDTFLEYTPAFEYRDNNEYSAQHNAGWAGALGYNGPSAHGDEGGGFVEYANPPGFVHTSYNLVAGKANKFNAANCKRNGTGPCTSVLEAHPEWFWPKDDPSVYGQLCWSEPSLQAYLKMAVREILAGDPDANIVSVSQNDNPHYCNTTAEAAIIAEEGSPMGPMLRAINAIAEDIAADYPHVAVDTLAYQYTRPAPSKTVPRANVIIRLCSIECNFAAPFSDPSNAPFQKDMDSWAKISNRTYIWNYVTNFGNFLQPFPNYYVLGPNLKYLQAHGVVGVFEEGSYPSPGGDMEHLKDYVIGRMLVDPSLDPEKLIQSFLAGYYGPGAPYVEGYITTFHKSVVATKYYMIEDDPWTAPFLTPTALLSSMIQLKKGAAAAGVLGTKYEDRITVVMMAVQYVVLLRWTEVQTFATQHKIEWPFAQSKPAEFASFNATATKVHVTAVREWGGCGLVCFHAMVFPNKTSTLPETQTLP